GVVGVAPLNPENVTNTVFPVLSLASGSVCVTARLGSGALSIAVHTATPDPSTVDDTATRPSDAPVYCSSLPLTSVGNTPSQLRYSLVTVVGLGGTGTIGLVKGGLTAVHDFGCAVVGGSVKTNGCGSAERYTRLDPK